MTAAWGWLLGWGVLAGVDLVSVPQVMIARPLVAGTVAGLILGDPLSGALVGAALELFALDVLPVGAVRYPDYGIGAIAAATSAAGSRDPAVLGAAIALGLLVAYLGELGMGLVRRLNTADVRRWRERLDRGDRRSVIAIHVRGLARDVGRSAVVTAAGLILAALIREAHAVPLHGAMVLTVVTVGAAVGAAATGAMRLGGRGVRLGWFVLGLTVGAGWVVAQ